jgi:hypothetical protein
LSLESILLLYLVALFIASAFAGAKTGGAVVTAAGIWVGQIICQLAIFFIAQPIYYRVTGTKLPPDAGQGEGILFVLAVPFMTIVGGLVSLAGIWFTRLWMENKN